MTLILPSHLRAHCLEYRGVAYKNNYLSRALQFTKHAYTQSRLTCKVFMSEKQQVIVLEPRYLNSLHRKNSLSQWRAKTIFLAWQLKMADAINLVNLPCSILGSRPRDINSKSVPAVQASDLKAREALSHLPGFFSLSVPLSLSRAAGFFFTLILHLGYFVLLTILSFPISF